MTTRLSTYARRLARVRAEHTRRVFTTAALVLATLFAAGGLVVWLFTGGPA